MNYTQNLRLPQWEGSDRIHHDDFNEAFGKIDTALAGGVKIATGSYVGTGLVGPGQPTTLSFDFTPKLVAVMTNGANFVFKQDVAHWALFVRGVTEYQTRYASDNINGRTAHVQWGEHSVSWYLDSSTYYDAAQLNGSGKTYYYVAIG